MLKSMIRRRDASDDPPEYPRAPVVPAPESPPATFWCHDVLSGSMPLQVILFPRLWEAMITDDTANGRILWALGTLMYPVVYPYSVWGSLFCGGMWGR